MAARIASLRRAGPFAALIGCFLLGGCQSLDLSSRELTWQSLHAVDVAQTLSAAEDPCYEEEAWMTRRLIGRQPSDAEVMAWGVGTAVGHLMVTNLLERMDAPRWAQRLWSYGTISYTGLTIGSNYDEGVRIGGDNEPVPGCYL